MSLDFEDHPFEVQTFEEPCALCGGVGVFLDEVILDDKGGRMFVCSDSDYCEDRRVQGHKGPMAPDGLAVNDPKHSNSTAEKERAMLNQTQRNRCASLLSRAATPDGSQ